MKNLNREKTIETELENFSQGLEEGYIADHYSYNDLEGEDLNKIATSRLNLFLLLNDGVYITYTEEEKQQAYNYIREDLTKSLNEELEGEDFFKITQFIENNLKCYFRYEEKNIEGIETGLFYIITLSEALPSIFKEFQKTLKYYTSKKYDVNIRNYDNKEKLLYFTKK